MSSQYWKGRDDFEYQGYSSPPRCDRGDPECRRAQRDYEDGYHAAEREREEAQAQRRAIERRQAEEWEEQERQELAGIERAFFQEQERQEELAGECAYLGHPPIPEDPDGPLRGLTSPCACGDVVGYMPRYIES